MPMFGLLGWHPFLAVLECKTLIVDEHDTGGA